MPEERIQYSEVLADLENRRNALNTRISSIDAAIEGIRALLTVPTLGDTPNLGAAVRSTPVQSTPTQQQTQQQTTARSTQTALATIPAPKRTYVPPAYQTHGREVVRSAAQGHSHSNRTDQRRNKPGLNIYVNQFPEWSRAMSRGNLHFRKKAGVRCPKCGSSDTRESTTRRISDFIMMLFDHSNARCRNCDTRFRIWKQQAGPELKPVRALD